MKNLIIVSAAVGILSGTSLRAIAQTSIKPVHLNTGTQKAKTVKFIEGIEFKPEASSHVNGMRLLEPVNQFFPVVNTSLSALTVSAIESCNQLQFKYALLMDLEVETISDMKLYGFIDDWWATRYRYGGTGRKGIDCSSFTGKLFAEVFHINLPRTAHAQYATCTRLKKDELTAGDLVFFNTRGGISHVGVYLGNHKFAHASVHSGVTISSLEESYYSNKFICGGRPDTNKINPTESDSELTGTK